MAMEIVDLMQDYEIQATVSYILTHGFTRVALQFPDDLLSISVDVTMLLKSALAPHSHCIDLYVMADTTYGSCCVDEIAAAHVDAQVVVHYGHACLSQTSRLNAYFVFGRRKIGFENCCRDILRFSSEDRRPVVVFFALDYAYAIEEIRREVEIGSHGNAGLVIFADVPSREMEPIRGADSSATHRPNGPAGMCCQGDCRSELGSGGEVASGCLRCERPDAGSAGDSRLNLEEDLRQQRAESSQQAQSTGYCIGGLNWSLPEGITMDDVAILWIGEEGAALTNLMLTYNKHNIVRYNAVDEVLVRDLRSKSRDLMRRFYLVERAKEASIVGIVVGTLGVAGYNEAVKRVREIVASAGKKSYTMVMGRPNPAKLANFPECDVFVLVACAQTILLDSKEYLAPLITPFEAELAFVEGREWTGAFSLEFGQLPKPSKGQVHDANDIKITLSGDADENASRAITLSEESERALQSCPPSSLAVASSGRANTGVMSSSEYLTLRSYQGLEIHDSGAAGDTSLNISASNVLPVSYKVVEGRFGRAAVYSDEAANV